MASHESYYTSLNQISSPPPPPPPPPATSQPSANAGTAPPPPPPPKSHDPSRTSTPLAAPPIPPHPNASQFQSYSQPSPTPPPVPQTPSYPSQQNPDHNPYQQQTLQHQQQQQQDTIPSFPQPTSHPIAIPPPDSGWLPEGLKDHSTTDLQPLLNNAELIDAYAKQHPAYRSALEPLQAAVAANLALAQHVAQQEAQVKQLRDQTGQLLLNHTSLQTQWRRKQSEMDDALSPWGPRAMYSRLVSSINEQEALIQAVHESFVEGGGGSHEYYGNGDGKAPEKEVTEWIKRLREGTTILERRREMRQRWDEGRVGGWR